MSKPHIILSRPQLGENIGAAARIMYNFGLQSLRLISPRDGWPNEEANATAAGAKNILILQSDKIEGKDNLAEIVTKYYLENTQSGVKDEVEGKAIEILEGIGG